jgi:hypothetical protein
MKKRGIVDLAGEYLREVSVLGLVFGILENSREGAPSKATVVMVVVISAVTFLAGYICERLRDDQD